MNETAQPVAPGPSSSGGTRRTLGRLAGALGPLLALALITLSFSIADYTLSGENGSFNSIGTVLDAGTQSVVVGTAALGMLLIIISGGIDLSVGNAIGVCAVVLALAIKAELGIPAALALTIGAGVATGFLNGVLITSLRVVPFIITLGTMSFYLGFAKFLGDENTVRPLYAQIPAWIQRLMKPAEDIPADVDPNWIVPYVLPNFVPGVWFLFAVAALTSLILHRTVFGRYVFAVGSNEATARLCGVNVAAVKIAVYTLAGLFVGFAGVFQFARLSIGNPTSGSGLELQVIAAVVVGGASLSGGRGNVLGTLAGAVLMVVIARGGSALGFSTWVQDMLLGAIIVAAAAIDQLRQRRLAGSA